MPASATPVHLSVPHRPVLDGVPFAVRATLLAASMMTVMAGAAVAAALPLIKDAFAAHEDRELLAKLVLSLPALAIACFAPVSGWVADRFGRKRLLTGGLVLYVIAGTSGLYLEEPYPILAGRLLLGVAVAMVITASTTLVSDYFSGPARATFMGRQAMFMSLGGVLFIPLGELLSFVGWHAPFAIYILGLPVLALAIKHIREPDRTTAPEPTADAPAVRTPWATVVLLCGIAFASMLAFYLGPVQVPFHWREVFGVRQGVGLVLAAMTLAGAITASQYGRIARNASAPWLIALMFLAVGIGYSVIGHTARPEVAFAGLTLAGFGAGLMMPTLSTWMMRVAPPHLRGRLSGVLMSALFLGQSLSPKMIALLKDDGGNTWVFAAVGGALVALAACFAATLLLRKLRRPLELRGGCGHNRHEPTLRGSSP